MTTSVLISVAAERLGYTPKAIERKIETGVWTEKIHWHKAPDGHRFIDLDAIDRWIKGQTLPANDAGGKKVVRR